MASSDGSRGRPDRRRRDFALHAGNSYAVRAMVSQPLVSRWRREARQWLTRGARGQSRRAEQAESDALLSFGEAPRSAVGVD
jgi:hypothetical protein